MITSAERPIPHRILGFPPQRVKGSRRTATLHHSPVRSLQMGGTITHLLHTCAWSAEGQLHKSTYTEIYRNINPSVNDKEYRHIQGSRTLTKCTHTLSNQQGKYSDSNHRISLRYRHVTGFTIFVAAVLQYLNTTTRSR
jgi:hypothetical protein